MAEKDTLVEGSDEFVNTSFGAGNPVKTCVNAGMVLLDAAATTIVPVAAWVKSSRPCGVSDDTIHAMVDALVNAPTVCAALAETYVGAPAGAPKIPAAKYFARKKPERNIRLRRK